MKDFKKLIMCFYIISLNALYSPVIKSSEIKQPTSIEKIGVIRAANEFFKLLAQQIPIFLDYIEYIRTGLKLAIKYNHIDSFRLSLWRGYFVLDVTKFEMLQTAEIVLLLLYPQLGLIIPEVEEEKTYDIPFKKEILTSEEKNKFLNLYKQEKTPDTIKLSIGFLLLADIIRNIEHNLQETIKTLNDQASIIHTFNQKGFEFEKEQLRNIITIYKTEVSPILENRNKINNFSVEVLNIKDDLLEIGNKLKKTIKKLKASVLKYQKDLFNDFNELYQKILDSLGEELKKRLNLPYSLPSIGIPEQSKQILQLDRELSLKDIELEPAIKHEEFLPKVHKKKELKKPVKKKAPKKKEEKPKEEIEELEEEPEEVPKLKEEKKEEEIPALAANTIVIQDDSFNATITLFKAKIAEQERPKVGPLEYTQSIKEWLENPQQALAKKMESMPKLKPGRKVEVTEERQIFLHAFSKKVDQYINECGKWKEFKNIRTKKKDYFIQMPAQVKRAEESPYLALVEYAVAERKGGSWLCYHRNLVEVSPQEFFTEWFGFDKAVIPAKIYQEEFPALKA